jgi:RNA polymerase sigma-70 factor, ECF subfamily
MKFDDEKTLIAHLKKSDLKAFDEIFHRYKKKIFHFCKLSIGSEEEAEEVVQSAFIAIWENRLIIDENRSFETYLFSIVRHHIYNILKRRTYRRAFLESLEHPDLQLDFSLENQIFFNDLDLLLKKLLNTLPAKRKEIFMLSREEGLTYKQIGEKLGISENTVDSQIRNVLNYLRPILEKFLE